MIASTAPSPAAPQGDAHMTNLVTFAYSGSHGVESPLLIDAKHPKRSITKEQAIELTAAFAGAFLPGSTVCLHLFNDILYPILCFSIWASECVWTGSNPAYKAPELEHLFRATKTRYVITEEAKLEHVREAISRSGLDIEIIIFEDVLSLEQDSLVVNSDSSEEESAKNEYVHRRLHQLMLPKSKKELFELCAKIKPNSIACLMSTSGTTGKPKAAARTHAALVYELLAIEDHEHKPWDVRRLYCTPIFHSFSTSSMVVGSMRLGFPSYFMQRFSDVDFPEFVERYDITETFAAPPIVLRLVNNKACHSKLLPLRNIYSAGAPFTAGLRSSFNKAFGPYPPLITPVWGMTEGGWYTMLKYPESQKSTTVGRPIAGLEIKVVRGDWKNLENGREVGELYVKSPGMMLSYHDNKDATVNTFEDGWLKTGDVGYVKDGLVFLIDRAKDIIKVNGFQVSPTELEETLMQMENVKEAAVVGVGPDVDEHPVAFIVLVDPEPYYTEHDYRSFLSARLVTYKWSKCIFHVVDKIVKNDTGKIVRSILKDRAKQLAERRERRFTQ